MNETSPLRVLVVVHGGAGLVTASLLDLAAGRGLDLEVVVLQAGPLVARFTQSGTKVRVLKSGRLRSPISVLNAIWQIRRAAVHHRAELIYSTEAKGHIYGGIAAAWAGIPAVWRQPARPRPRSPIDQLARRIPAARIIVESTFIADEQRKLGRGTEIIVVPPGIDLSRHENGDGVRVRQGYAIPIDAPLAVLAGRLQPWKGQDLFLQAAARILKTVPDAHFAVVGGSDMGWERGDCPRDLARLADRLSIAHRVHFTGHTDSVQDWYAAADVAVNASDHEPFGLVLLESMAHGVPPVAFALGGPCEIVDHGRTGLLVSPRDPHRLAQATSRLMMDDALRERLGRGAREQAHAYFSREQMVDALVDVFRAVATRTPAEHIAIVLPVAVEGGAGVVAVNLALAARAAGARLSVVALADGPMLSRLTSIATDVRLLDAGRLRSVFRLLATARQLRRTLDELAPDGIIANESKAQIYTALALLGSRKRHVWFQHARPQRHGIIDRIAMALPADAVFVASSFIAREQQPLRPSVPVKVVVPGIDLDGAQRGSGAELRRREGIAADEKLVSIVGRLQPWKGQDLFLRAAAQVLTREPRSRFAIIGSAEMGWEQGDFPGQLAALAAQLGIGARVHLTGQVEDVSSWYAASDLVVSASDGEPFGLVLIEAMAAGCPVVAIAGSGSAEIVEHERTGLLIENRTSGALAGAMTRLLSDAELRRRLGAAGRARALEHFSHHRMYRDVVEAIAAWPRSATTTTAAPPMQPWPPPTAAMPSPPNRARARVRASAGPVTTGSETPSPPLPTPALATTAEPPISPSAPAPVATAAHTPLASSVAPGAPSGTTTPLMMRRSRGWPVDLVAMGMLAVVLVYMLTRGTEQFGTKLAVGPLVLLVAAALVFNPRVELSLGALLLYLGLLDGFLKLKTGSNILTVGRDVLLYAIAAGVLIRAVVSGDRLRWPRYTPHVALFVAVVLVQALNPAAQNATTVVNGYRQHLEFIPLFFLGYAFLGDARRLRAFFALLLLVASINGVVSVVQSQLTPQQLAAWGPGYAERVLGEGQFSGAARVFADQRGRTRVRPPGLGSDFGFGGGVGVLAIPGGLLLFGTARARRSRNLALVGLMGSAAAVIVSQSRLSVVTAVLTAMFYGVLAGRTRQRRRLITRLIVGATILYAFISIFTAHPNAPTTSRYGSIKPSSIIETTKADRGGSVTLVPAYIRDYFVGAGIGRAGPASGRATEGRSTLNAENEPNFLIIELGVAGLVVLLSLWIRVTRDGVRILRALPDEDAVCMAAIVATLATLLVVWLVATVSAAPPDSPFFWLSVGVIARKASEVAERRRAQVWTPA